MHEHRFKEASRNNGGGYNEAENSASGILTVTARISNGASRYAMPSPGVSDFDYAALLYPANNENQNFVQGKADGNKLTFSFQRPDETSGLTLEIFAFAKLEAEADGGARNFSRESAILFGKETECEVIGDKIEVSEPIALAVNENSEEPGSVNLKIEVPAGCTLEIDDAAKANFKCEKENATPNTYVITASGILAKSYPVKFTVMDGEKIVQVFTEYINVLHGMRTDTWGGLAKGSAKEIKITNSASTTFFVRGSGAGWYTENDYANITGDDANAGDFLHPFATIQKAVNEVLAKNDGASTYTIYLDGKFTATSANALADFDALSQPLSLKILGLSASSKAVLDGNGTARGIVVGSSSARKDMNLTLENLTVQNAAGYGIMLCCQSANSHTIKKCEIKNNGGSGIYKYYGSLDLQECEISGNNTTSDGGGVYSREGSLTMTECKVSKNTTGRTGGGVYTYYGALTMTKCIISENIATGVGGGVYDWYDKNITMEGCTISGNTTTSNGGGVYFTPQGSSSPDPVMKDCTVSGNEASKGKGACLSTSYYKPKLMLDGTTKFAQADDIYLSNGTSSGSSTVGVMSTLETAAPIATITPYAYTAGTQVLRAGTDVEITQDICDLFNVTPQKSETDESVTEWEIVPKSGDSTAGVLAAK